jgi:hypothetical protein
MNKRSCLVQVVLFGLAILVLAMLVRRTFSAPEGGASAGGSGILSFLGLRKSGAQVSEAAKAAVSPQGTSQAGAPAAQGKGSPTLVATLDLKKQPIAAAAAPVAAAAQAISTPAELEMPGLSLLLSRPLMFPLPRLRGLAAGARFLYLSVYDTTRRAGFVYQVDKKSYAITQMRDLANNQHMQPGGMHLGKSLLWVPLTGEATDPNSTILGVDPITLEIRVSMSVPVRVGAVAEAENGLLYGFTDDGANLIEWSQDGRELRRKSADFLAAFYQDMEVIGGSLVCAGTGPEGGVIDVIDPSQLSLLRHYPCPAKSGSGQYVTGRGFAYSEGMFLFAPDEGNRPHILSYSLEPGLKLPDYIPGVAP